ncbi:DUF4870 family protein [Burkholderia pseudomallei]|uniref:DUF4870 family protein n=1 Tax=Burkholderia pseudomallei TaxID=28450 RepID=UPI000538AFB9|nr:DUF4870 domain-containing protein [Burkholderia pseudomallei]KGU71873.1 putative transmembrane protein [Burkholderia pseudomallei MSHR4304]KGV29468.1 putative transmembrane protein [Burkholderia pseudomallei MSHR4308]KGV70055.1 putative transmembrane protein [Burkholderia pseudomallei MSHR4375]KGW13632.1 putative transmembrane protein [Burkholderia pseudomallei MSHR4303]ONC79640.1 hypothetical protein AQ920_00685 [Burkholderia pseudomallei]
MPESPNQFPPSYQSAAESERQQSLRTLTHILYLLYAIHWLTGGITGIVAIIINYVKRDDAVGTAYQAHFEWQIRTFWRALIAYLIGFALLLVGIGFIVLGAVWIWTLYRIIKGWLYLNDNKTLDPQAWF